MPKLSEAIQIQILLIFLQNASTLKSMKKQQEGESEAHFLSKIQIQISQDKCRQNTAKLFTNITYILTANKCLNAVKNHCLHSDNHIIYIIKRNIKTFVEERRSKSFIMAMPTRSWIKIHTCNIVTIYPHWCG